MSTWETWLQERAQERVAAGLQRTLAVRSTPSGMPTVGADPIEPGTSRPTGPALIDLASNDYLGLSDHPEVIDAAQKAVVRWGAGSRASRLVSGTTPLHTELEVALAEFVGTPDALVFSSGYTANLGAITALADTDTTIVSDQHVHASLIDACRLTKAHRVITPHNDVAAIESALTNRKTSRAMIVVESIYSVLSDAAPLPQLAELAADHNALLVIDEAHGVGVAGDGRGAAAAAQLTNLPQVVLTATLSKALGSQGGAVLGSDEVIDHLVNHARSFIFDTALAPAPAAAARAALGLVNPTSVGRLRSRVSKAADQLGVTEPAGAVLSVPMASPEAALAAQAACRDRGVWVGCFRPPSVPDGVSRLRITVNAGLDEVAWQHALSVVSECVKGTR